MPSHASVIKTGPYRVAALSTLLQNYKLCLLSITQLRIILIAIKPDIYPTGGILLSARYLAQNSNQALLVGSILIPALFALSIASA